MTKYFIHLRFYSGRAKISCPKCGHPHEAERNKLIGRHLKISGNIAELEGERGYSVTVPLSNVLFIEKLDRD